MICKAVFVSCLFSLAYATSVEKLTKGGETSLNCEDCKIIALTVGALAISPGGLEASAEYVREPVCAAMPAEFECEKNIGWFWSALASWMFNPFEGWYAPKYFCMDVCSASELNVTSTLEAENEVETESDSGPSCKDCNARLFANTAFMSDKATILKAVGDFKKAKFCDTYAAAKDVARCNAALDIVLPVGMTALSKSGDKWIDSTCKEAIKCHA